MTGTGAAPPPDPAAPPLAGTATDPAAPSIVEVDRAMTAPGQPFEIEEVTIRGVRTRTWKHAPPSLLTLLESSRHRGAADFLVYEDERVTFETHYRTVAALARRLQERIGVRKGDRVAIAMRNLPEWVMAFWATIACGAVAVPLNAWWTGEELRYALADSASRAVFADPDRADRIRPFAGELPELHALVVAGGHVDPVAGGHTVPSEAAEWTFPALLGDVGTDTTLPDVSVGPEDDATIFYTSGTTGRPKGAVGTHRNACTNLMNLYYVNARDKRRFGSEPAEPTAAEPGPAAPAERLQRAYLLSVPLFHATGCHATMITNLAVGGKLVLLHHFDPERALELIERERVTGFGGVPAMVLQVLDSPDLERRDTSSIRTVSYGGAPAPPDLVRRIAERFPVGRATNGYGLTETSAITTLNSGQDYLRKPDSVGPPLPVTEVAVVPDGDDGHDGAGPEGAGPVEPQRTGELWVKGPQVVRGYWNHPEETAQAFRDGWLRTGDIARIDDEGFVFIVDRAKDVVIRGGENVYSVEVEAALSEHPAVADCAVIGIPHDVLGEEVGAVIVLRPGAEIGADELARHVGDRLAAYNVPSRLWFRRAPLPRNPAGKVLKRALRDELLGD